MTEHEILRRFPHASRSTVKANVAPGDSVAIPEPEPAKRIRQSSKPVMNKLEQEFFNLLDCQFPNYPRPRAQAVRFKLCNGVTFTPDIFIASWPWDRLEAKPTAFEVKGAHAWDDAIVKIKMAAHEWLEIRWVLAWKEEGQWKQQLILD